MIVSIVTLWHCSSPAKKQIKEITENRISIDDAKLSGVSFKFIKKIKTELIFYPRLSVSNWHDKIIFYGLDKSTGGMTQFTAITYTKDLEPLNKKSFQFGAGPGDVGNFNIITVAKDNIFIHENSNLRVSIFDLDWNFKDIEKYKMPLGATTINTRDKYLIHGELGHHSSTKSFFEFSIITFPGFGAKTLYMSPPFPIKKKIGNRYKSMIGGSTEYSWFFKDNEIFLLMCGSYRLMKFDASGGMSKNVIADVPKIEIEADKTKDFWEQPDFKNYQKRFYLYEMLDPASMMIPLGKGFIVVRRKNNYADQCRGFCKGDYYSFDVEYKGKVKVPCFYDIFEVSPGRNHVNLGYTGGYFYLITESNEDYYIEKWQVKE